MLTDIAVGQRAVDGVGDGMHGHIRVRMARESLVVGDVDTAQGDVIPRGEAVDVKSVAEANIHEIPEPVLPVLGSRSCWLC